MRALFLIPCLLGLAACATPEPELTGDDPVAGPTAASSGGLRLGNGYRAADDQCRRAGVTELTAPFASTESDLVACPIDFEGRPAFIRATSAREVTRTAEYVVYTVPLIGNAPVTNIPVTPAITGQG